MENINGEIKMKIMKIKLLLLLFLCENVVPAQNTNHTSEEKWGLLFEQPEITVCAKQILKN